MGAIAGFDAPPSASLRLTFFLGSRRSSVSAGTLGAGATSGGLSSAAGFLVVAEAAGVLGFVTLSSDLVVAIEKSGWILHGLGGGRFLGLPRRARGVENFLTLGDIATEQTRDIVGVRSEDHFD